MKTRLTFIGIVLLIIGTGLLSRQLPLPFFIGDALYAMMIYFILRTSFIEATSVKIFILTIILCFAIEFSQLMHEPWLLDLRRSWIGRHVLGSGFLITDLIAYVGGATIAFLLDKVILARLKN